MRLEDMTPIDPHRFSIDEKIIVWAYIGVVLVVIQYILFLR